MTLVLEAERKRWASGEEFSWLRPVSSHLNGGSFASLGLIAWGATAL